IGGADGGNKYIRIKRRPGRHGENVARLRLDHDDGAALRTIGQQLLRSPLYLLVDRGDDIVPWLRRYRYILREPISDRIVAYVHLARPARELLIKRLFQAFPPFKIRPQRVTVLHGSFER